MKKKLFLVLFFLFTVKLSNIHAANCALSSSLSPTAVCSGSGFNYTANSSDIGATFSWTRAVVAGISNAAGSGSNGNISETLTNTTTNAINVTYAITISGTSCTTTTQNVVVSVKPTPTLSSTLTPTAICSGTNFSYTATSATTGTTFSWSRAAVAGISNAAGSGTNGNISETLTNTTANAINVTYLVTLTANACINTENVVVSVKPTPTLTSSLTPVAICSGINFSYSATSGVTGTTFSWSRAVVPGISNAAGGGSNGNVSETLTNTTTNSINVTYVFTLAANGCTNSQNVIVSVKPTPTLSSTLTPTACSGTIFSYSAISAVTGTTFSWTRAVVSGISNAAGSGSNGNISEILLNTTANAINVTYVFTLTANGCNNTQNVIVSVKPLPTLSSTLTPTACSGTIFSYSAISAVTGTTFSWTRAVVSGISNAAGSGSNGNISEILLNTTANAINVTYVFTLTANGCNSTQNVIVSVKPLPTLSSTLTPTAICSGTNFGYAATSATSGTTFSWSRAAVIGISNAAGSGSNGSISETLTNTTANAINVTYVVTLSANGCTNTQNVIVSVNPGGAPTLTSTLTPSAICSGSAFSYSPASNFSATFSWSRTAVAGISNPTVNGTGSISEILTNTTTNAITVTYVYTLNTTCATNTQNVTVSVKPTPTLTSSLTPAAICSGTNFSYSATSDVTGTNFSWSRAAVTGISNLAGSGSNGNISETLTNTTTNAINVTYVFNLAASGCSNTQNVVVSVKPTPSLSNTLPPVAICSGTNFSFIATSDVTGTSFSWSRAAVTGISNAAGSGTNGNINETLTNTTANAINVTYSITLTANSCQNTQNVVVSVKPTPTLSSTLTPLAICSNFTYNATSATSGTTFSWTRAVVSGISNAAGSGSNGNISETLINTTANPINVTYNIILTANGCTNNQNVVVQVNPSPSLSSTLTPSAICSGGNFSYNATSATAGASFSWSRAVVSGISNPVGSGSNNIINETLTNSTANPITVTYIFTLVANSCSTNENVTLIVNPTPALNSGLNPTPVCNSTTFSYMPTSATAGASFSWSRPILTGISNPTGNGTGAINEVLNNTTANSITVAYNYTIVANGCTNTQTVNIIVRPTPILSSSLTPSAICSSTNFIYTATSATTNATFSWTRAVVAGISNVAGSGSNANINETLINSTSSPIIVVYIYTLTTNNCTNTQNITLTVNPTPALTSTLSPTAICEGAPFNYTPLSATVGTTFSWSRNLVAGITNLANSGTNGVSEILNANAFNPVDVVYNYTMSANNCSNTQNVTITINPIPELNSTLNPIDLCSNNQFLYNATSLTNGTNFIWDRPSVLGITNPSANGTNNINESLENITAAPIQVLYNFTLSANGCQNNSTVTITINPGPSLNSSTTLAPICNGGSVTYNPTSATTGASFSWNRPQIAGITNATNGTSSINEILNNTNTNAVTVVYIYTVSANGCSSSNNVEIIVDPTPVLNIPLTAANNQYCNNTPFDITLSSLTNSLAFNWQRPFVNGITNPVGSGTDSIAETLINNSNTNTYVDVPYDITLTTSNNCINTQTLNVRVYPTIILNSTNAGAICSGFPLSFPVSSPNQNANQTMGYSWARTTANVTPGSSFASGATINDTLTNLTTSPITLTYLYTVTITNSTPGCSANINVTATLNPTPRLNSLLTPPAICTRGEFSYIPTSLTQSSSFNWARPNVFNINNNIGNLGIGNPTEILINSTEDQIIPVPYIYTSNANNCSGIDTVVVLVQPAPFSPVIQELTLSNASFNSFCGNSKNISMNVVDPNPNYIYEWIATSGIQLDSIEGTKNANIVADIYSSGMVELKALNPSYSVGRCRSENGQREIIVSPNDQGIQEKSIIVKENTLLMYPDNTIEAYRWGYDSITTLRPYFIEGATAQVFSPEAKYLKNGKLNQDSLYFWVTVYKGACRSKIYLNGPFKRTQNIEEVLDSIPDNLSLQVLPNPNNGYFELQVNGNVFGLLSTYVYNSLGQLMSSISIEKLIGIQKFRMQLPDLPKGVYFVETNGPKGERITTKFLIK